VVAVSFSLDRVGAPNLKLAVSAALLAGKPPSAQVVARLKDSLGLWLVAASRSDAAGRPWDAHAPIHSMPNLEWLAQLLILSPGTPTILDALYASQDEEYLDAVALERVCHRRDGNLPSRER